MGKKCIILIDGSNFYFKLKDLGLHNLLEFDFLGFSKSISKNQEIVIVTYYVGKISTDGTQKTQELFDNQRKLFANFRKQNVRYSLGYLLKTNDRYHEKGVDVAIAVDILVATYENLCDRIILISSDTDLLPAIDKARKKGKIVEYVGFSHKPSVAMVARCNVSRLLTKDDLLPFLTKNSQKNPAKALRRRRRI